MLRAAFASATAVAKSLSQPAALAAALLAFGAFARGAAGALEGSAELAAIEAPSLQVRTLMSGLSAPWDLAFAPDGSMFFTERCRGLSVRLAGGRVVRLFGASGSAIVAPDFVCEAQAGMNGVAVDPNFGVNRLAYVFMASRGSDGAKSNRIVRLAVAPNYASVSGRTDIVTDISYKRVGNRWGAAGMHNGGRIRFGPDGFLYVTTGDNHEGLLPQDLRRLGGKTLRIHRDGRPAPGNGAPAGADPRVFSYGHRNIQGIAFQPVTGTPYVAEHGPGHSDEVTALRPGGNAGWDPRPAPGVQCEDNYCGYVSNRPDGRPTSMTDLEKFPDAIQPAYVYADSQGLRPATFLSGPEWKSWNGRLAVGIMASRRDSGLPWARGAPGGS